MKNTKILFFGALLALNILAYVLLIRESQAISHSQAAIVEGMNQDQSLNPILMSNLIDIARYPSRSTRLALITNVLYSVLLAYNFILYLLRRKNAG